MKDRIKLVRKTLDLTQQEFADRLGIKRGAIANYEIGRNEPVDSVISLICREFNVNECWLRDGSGEMFFELDKENQLMQWAGTVLADEPESFRKRFLAMLMSLDENDWIWLEKKAKMLVQTEDKDTDK